MVDIHAAQRRFERMFPETATRPWEAGHGCLDHRRGLGGDYEEPSREQDTTDPLIIINHHRDVLYALGKEPNARLYGDPHGNVKYRDSKTGQFISEENALEILSSQISNSKLD